MHRAADKTVKKRKTLAKASLKNILKRRGTKGDRRHFVMRDGAAMEAEPRKRQSSAGGDAPLAFYAVVEIKRTKGIPAEARGRAGVVVGRAQTPTGGWNYSVSVRDLDDSYYLPHSALTATGVILKREDLYGGDKLQVQVDASGAGTAKH